MTYDEYDRLESERNRHMVADAEDAREAEIAREMSETENEDGTITMNEPADLSWPAPRFDMLASVSDWARAVSLPRQYAEIMPGIAVRVGSGGKRRAA